MRRTHEASWESDVRADPSVHLNLPLLEDHHGLLVGQSVLKPVPEEHEKRERIPELVRASGWPRCLNKKTGEVRAHKYESC
jgi:hypothetical protein